MSSKSVSFFLFFVFLIYFVHLFVFLIFYSIHLFLVFLYRIFYFVLLFFLMAPSESVLCVGSIGITGGLLGLGLCEASNLS